MSSPFMPVPTSVLTPNSVVYQKELRRLIQHIDEQRVVTEDLLRAAHAELRKREVEITRLASDLKDRQAEMVSSHMGITDAQQSELAELMDKTRAWEQAKHREVVAAQAELRAAEAEVQLWKAKFAVRTQELESAQECAEVYASQLALALEAESQKRARIEAEHRIALARSIDTVKRDASQLVALARREQQEEHAAIMEAAKAAHEAEISSLKREFKQIREGLESRMEQQQKFAEAK